MPPVQTAETATTEQTGSETAADKLYGQENTSDTTEDKTTDDGGSEDKSTDNVDDKAEDKSEDKTEDKSEDKEEKEEEKPSLEIKVPEGVEVDKAVLDEVRSLAEQAGLNAEQIQPLVDLHFKQLEAQVEALTGASQKAWDDTISGWKDTINKDPDIGGDKAEAVQTALGKALDQFGSAEAREAFDLTGAGWNPHIIKFIYNMAKGLSEGTQVTPNNQAPKKPASAAEALYGSSTT